MQSAKGMTQPALGLLGVVVTIGLSLAISTAFAPDTFGTWVAFIVMCTTPAQIIIGLVWHNSYPGILARLGQPARGLAILAMLAATSCVVAPAVLFLVGGGFGPPTPFVNIYVILTIVATFWLVAVFQCWPAAAVSAHPAVVGVGTLVLAYVVAWGVFRAGFDFGGMAGAPFYDAALDPQGAFPAWQILSYVITTVAVIMALVLLDFWPLSRLVDAFPAWGRQPLFGLLVGTTVVLIAGLLWYVGVRVAAMDMVDYMVRVPVSLLFGDFILLTLFQAAASRRLPQPAKGAALIAGSAALAILTHGLYRFTALAAFGALPAGAPAYGLELWIATAMLSITFPIIVAYGEGFACWPFAGTANALAAPQAATQGTR